MARSLTAQEVFHQLTGVYMSSDFATTGTVSAAASAGQKDVTLTAGDVAAMSLSAGDTVRFGANGNTAEVMVIDSIATETLTGKANLARAVANGATATKITWVDLGATDENGVNIETTQGETAILAGTQKGTYLHINQNVEEAFNFALRDMNAENAAASLGISEAAADNYVTSSPEAVIITPENIATKTYQVWKFEGLLEGGETVIGVVYSAKVAAANQTLQFVEGQATIFPFTMRSNGSRCFIIE